MPKVERVQVTGSHIKRIEAEGPSPVQTLTRRDLEKSGYNSVSDVLRETGSNSFGSLRERSGSNAAGAAHVDLRGMGSSSTLVLLNGQRLPTDAVTGAVDLNLIPMAAIERIEMLKDGASATYGSDALGGVVNIITRKDFTGSEISLAQTSPQLKGGSRRDIGIVNGINGEKTNMVNVLQYRQNETVFSRDREWTSKGISTIGSPGSYRGTDGKWRVDPNCPPGMATTPTQQGQFCQFKHTDYSSELPALEQLSILSETNFEASSRVRLKARVGGAQKKAKWNYAPAPGTFTISGAKAQELGLPGITDPSKPVAVRYRLLELGNRDTLVETYSLNGLLGSTVDVGAGWEFDVAAGHSHVQQNDKGVNGYAITEDLVAAVENGTFNPVAPPGSRGSIEQTRYQPLEHTTSTLSSGDMKVTGPVLEMPSGPLTAAIGTTVTFQKYEDIYDERSVNGEVFGSAGSSGGGNRNTQAVYTELSIPVLSNLELQVAGRYDRYSDFGSTTNPKLAAIYRPIPSVMVRGSAGTGFKAPLMQDLYAATGDGFPTFTDVVACEAEQAAGGSTPSCLPQQYHVVSGGNTGLKEERTFSYNFGAAYEPSSAFAIGADYFVTRQTNVVGISYSKLTEAEARGVDVAAYGVKVQRDSDGYIETIEAPTQNLSARELSGIDLNMQGRIGKFKGTWEHSHLLYFREEGFPGTGMEEVLGSNGRPPWRNLIGLSYLPTEHHDINVSANTIAEHEKAVSALGKVDRLTTVDLLYTFKSKTFGSITAGVKNVAGIQPPLDDTNTNTMLDTTLYDQIGRQFYAGYKVNF
ncbi:MAG: TonB-dependent receptor [Bdellovibrionia bacterium]